MGTRCVIRVEGIDFAQVYKHFDGYPEGTLPWLEKFNQEFFENRGADPEYKMAQLLRSSAWDYSTDEEGNRSELHTGWGVMPYGTECGQEYTYTLKKDGKVKARNY